MLGVDGGTQFVGVHGCLYGKDRHSRAELGEKRCAEVAFCECADERIRPFEGWFKPWVCLLI